MIFRKKDKHPLEITTRLTLKTYLEQTQEIAEAVLYCEKSRLERFDPLNSRFENNKSENESTRAIRGVDAAVVEPPKNLPVNTNHIRVVPFYYLLVYPEKICAFNAQVRTGGMFVRQVAGRA